MRDLQYTNKSEGRQPQGALKEAMRPQFCDWAPFWDLSVTHTLHTHASINTYMDTRAQTASYTRPQLKSLITCMHINNQSVAGKS